MPTTGRGVAELASSTSDSLRSMTVEDVRNMIEERRYRVREEMFYYQVNRVPA